MGERVAIFRNFLKRHRLQSTITAGRFLFMLLLSLCVQKRGVRRLHIAGQSVAVKLLCS